MRVWFLLLVLCWAASAALAQNTPVTLSAPVVYEWEPGYVELSWTQSDSLSFAGYRVYRATHAGVTEADTLVSDQAGYPDWIYATVDAPATLTPGTTYYFRVFVVETGGTTAGSNEVSILRSDDPPAAVTLNPATTRQGYERSVDLSWSQNLEQDFQGYRVYRATHAGVTQADTLIASINYDPWTTSASVEALPTAAPGTTYYFRVFVLDWAGQVTGSNEVSINRSGDPAAPVTLFPASVSPSNPRLVDLRWSQSYNPSFAGYRVYRATHAGVTQADDLVFDQPGNPVGNAATVGAAPTATPGTTYYFRVFVVETGGTTAGSNEISITRSGTPPAAVVLNAPTPDPSNQNYLNLSWSQSEDLGFQSYQVYRATHAGVTEADTLISSLELDPLWTSTGAEAPATPSPGTTYYFRVFVVNQAGVSAGSNEVSITQIAAPAQPGVPLFSDITQTTLTATLPALPGGATSLFLQRKQAGEADTAYITVAQNQGGGAVIAVTGLYGSTNYIFRVGAIGPGGTTYSMEAPVTTAPAAPPQPGAPTFSELTEQSVRVHAPALPPSTAFLKLQMKTDAQSDAAYQDVATNLQGGAVTLVENLSGDTNYDFRYLAVGPGGSTGGLVARLAVPAPVVSWQSGVPISCGGIRWPLTTGNTIVRGAEGHLSSFLATDYDQRDVTLNGQIASSRPHTDTCSYSWSATFADGTAAGSFKNGVSRGQGVVWIAPNTAGTVTLRLIVDDQNSFNQGNREVGARNDAPRGYDDDALTFTSTISVLP